MRAGKPRTAPDDELRPRTASVMVDLETYRQREGKKDFDGTMDVVEHHDGQLRANYTGDFRQSGKPRTLRGMVVKEHYDHRTKQVTIIAEFPVDS